MIGSLAFILLANLAGLGPCDHIISGRVLDARTGEPLDRARVEAGDKIQPVRTDAHGMYRLEGICPGPVQLRVVKSEYALRSLTVTITDHQEVNVKLRSTNVVQDDEMYVQAPRLKDSDTRSVVSLEGDALLRTRGETLADALANLPGVSVLRNGTTAKPIVRGQYGARVLKLYDGVRHEGQDWGLDHGPEIDSFATGSMSVVKGSAGVRYGPDAIAGVVLIEPPALRTEPGVSLFTQTVGAFNGRRGAFAARLAGNQAEAPEFSWSLDGNYSRAAGLTTPNYPLDNTGQRELNVGGTLQYDEGSWTAKLSFRRNEKRSGVCLCVRNEATSDFEATLLRDRPVNSDLYRADYTIERPFQMVTHDTVLARTRFTLKGIGDLETTYAFQVNDRLEFDIIRGESSRAQFVFELRSHTFDIALEHTPIPTGSASRLEGRLGASGMLQENVYRGVPLLSDYRALSGGVFGIERLIFDNVELEAGLRYDHERREAHIPKKTYQSLVREDRIDPERCDIEENWSQCTSTFHTNTVSLGALVKMSEAFLAKFDLSSATRVPTIDEQYINGTSPSFPIMARGLAELGPETSWSLSGSLETNLSWLSAEVSTFGSFIDDYIYLSPELRADGTVRTDVLINGRFPRFAYTALDAFFYGADANAQLRHGQFDLGIQGSVVRATQADNGEFLLFIPSDRVRTELTYMLPELQRLIEPYLSVSAQFVARQYNVSSKADFAPVPDGYVLYGARTGTDFKWDDTRYTLGLEVQNALNTRYRDYTSMLRYYADEAGMQAFIRLGTEASL